jgi:hypothetical protein
MKDAGKAWTALAVAAGFLLIAVLAATTAGGNPPCARWLVSADQGSNSVKPVGLSREDAALQALTQTGYAEAHPSLGRDDLASSVTRAANSIEGSEIEVQGVPDDLRLNIEQTSDESWIPSGGSYCLPSDGKPLPGEDPGTEPSHSPDEGSA